LTLLNDHQLVVEVRRLAKINQRLPVLLLLSHLEQPAKTVSIRQKGVDIGFRAIRDWNVTAVLRTAAEANQVAQLERGWALLHPGGEALEGAGVNIDARPTVVASDSLLPKELFQGTRGYLERVAFQINASYDYGLFDCCAVMCRRLIETLIIEVYEAMLRADEIKGSDGHFLMMNGLLSVMLQDKTINLGRNSLQGLGALKELGDKSAHNVALPQDSRILTKCGLACVRQRRSFFISLA
jgi:hypothetical protein